MLIVTIDGPSGSGKGTVSKLLAERLGAAFLDSGALYRLVALSADRAGVDCDNVDALVSLARNLDVEFSVDGAVLLDGDDVSTEIRREQIGMLASKVAAKQPVRDALLQRQRDFAVGSALVADGRDMGTVVFPEAAVKIFLTASSEERARRRVAQIEAGGGTVKYDEVLADIVARDRRDSSRSVSPLVPAEDALVIDSSQLSIEQVLEQVLLQVEVAESRC